MEANEYIVILCKVAAVQGEVIGVEYPKASNGDDTAIACYVGTPLAESLPQDQEYWCFPEGRCVDMAFGGGSPDLAESCPERPTPACLWYDTLRLPARPQGAR